MTYKQKLQKHSFDLPTVLLFSFLLFFALTLYSVAQEETVSHKSIFVDRDRDGISDAEEKVFGTDPLNRDTDGDSYSDGVEVASGYDPVKAAPGDRLITDKAIGDDASGENVNTTKKLSQDLVSFTQKKQAEGVGGLGIEELTDVAEESVESSLSFDDLPEIDISQIQIKDQDYPKLSKKQREEKLREDDIEYFTSVAYILTSNSPQRISTQKDLEELIARTSIELTLFSTGGSTYFQEFASKGQEMLVQLEEVSVPQKHIEIHTKGLKLGGYAASLDEELVPDPDDPVTTVNTLARMQGLVSLFQDFNNELSTILDDVSTENLQIEL